MRIVFLSAALLLTGIAAAQQFNYNVSCDSAGTYQELTAQTLLKSGSSPWAEKYPLATGFPFSCLGRTFDSVRVERNGYLSFDADRSYAFMAFNAFSDKIDTAGNRSTLSYALSGSAPNRVLKLQFRNMGQGAAPAELLSYQIWLNENGAIEVHVGPHTYAIADSTNSSDTLMPVVIGLVNTNMDTPTRGLFLEGSTTQPGSRPVNDTYPDPAFIRSIPAQGTRYTFTPVTQ